MSAAPQPASGASPAAAADRERWRSMVAAVLARSGHPPTADPEQVLTRTTLDGIPIAALYTAADRPYAGAAMGSPGRPPYLRGATAGRGWDMRQHHIVDDVTGDVNAAIRDDVANGVTSVWLSVADPRLLAPALADVDLTTTAVVLDAGPATVEAAAAMTTLAPGWRGSIGADPIGWAHRTASTVDLDLAAEAWHLCEKSPQRQAIVVDATVYHDAGASDADELAIATAVGVAYLRRLADAGASIEDCLSTLEFRLAVTDDQFASMAKLRAARRVWDRVAQLCGAPEHARGQRQHAVTSAAMMTRRDPLVNVVRTTVAGFAAAVAGARSITVAPFDQAIGRSDAGARRIARNVQAVLHDEVSLARVADPAGGSWYVEARTEALARVAWSRFTELERRGGATDLNAVTDLVTTGRERRDALIEQVDWPITGVNRFPDAGEQPLSRVPVAAPAGPGLPRIRYAERDERGWPA